MKSNQYNSYIQWYNVFKDIPNVVKVVNNNIKKYINEYPDLPQIRYYEFCTAKIYLSRLYLPYIQGQVHVLWGKNTSPT